MVLGQGNESGQLGIDQIAKQKYQDFLEDDSELVSICNYQSIERIEKGIYVRKTYNPDKKVLLSVIEYRDKLQRKVTKYLDFYDNGSKLSEGQYKDALKVGEWKYYNYSDGQLESIGPYEYNKKHGDWKYFNANGRIAKTCKFDEGKIRGEVLHYDDHGQLMYKEIYKRGKRQEVKVVNESEYSKNALEERIFPLLNSCEVNENNPSKCLRKEVGKLFKQRNELTAKSMTMEGTGKIHIKFDVDSKGVISDMKILRGLSQEIDQITIDVMKRFPKFKPSSFEDVNVIVSFTVILDLGDELMDKSKSSPYISGILPLLMEDRVYDMYDKKRKEHFTIPIRIGTY